jgi:hypothetical protein
MAQPWERQPKETEASWGAFIEYRDLGPVERSLSKLSKKFKKSVQNFSVWSRKHDWVKRCAAYDSWMDGKRLEVDADEIKAMRRRHIQLGSMLQGVAALALKKLVTSEQTQSKRTLRPHEIRDLAELGAKLEQQSRGAENETASLVVRDGSGNITKEFELMIQEPEELPLVEPTEH